VEFQVIWSDAALCEFKAINDFLLARSISGAESVRLAILDELDAVARHPFRGATYQADRSGQTREVICGTYRIFYSVNEVAKVIEVLLVWHSARAEPDLRR
jgi:plasmid stabilization system protein ParE